jgi:hypothetical protein
MADINDLAVVDASNTARFPENQSPSSLNDAARALEGIIARWHKDTNASIAAGGTGDAITVSANQTLSAYYDGLVVAFNATAANTTTCTLNVDSVGAKKVLKHFNTALAANDIKVGQKVIVIYDSDGDSAAGAWQMVSPLGNAGLSSADGIAQGLHTIYIPATAMVSRTTNGAVSGTVETSSNKVMLKTLDFDASTIEYAQFSIRMPKSWDEGTISAAFTWSHTATSTNFKVSWGLQGVAISDDDAGDAAFGTAQYANDTGGTANDIYVSPETAAITVAGSPMAEDWTVFQILRKADDGTNDTLAVDARLHGVTLYYTVNASTDS